MSEVGNLSAHLLLKNLRPPGTSKGTAIMRRLCLFRFSLGTTTRRIPRPDYNPLNGLFNYVSCPNYTYEVGKSGCANNESTSTFLDYGLDCLYWDDSNASR